MTDLPLDDLAAPGKLVAKHAFGPEQRHCRADWGQRVPKLVRERGQELVLSPVVFTQALRVAAGARTTWVYPTLLPPAP